MAELDWFPGHRMEDGGGILRSTPEVGVSDIGRHVQCWGTSWRALKPTGVGYVNTNNDHRLTLKDRSASTGGNVVFLPGSIK